jgi:HlyD family secretion protein
MNKKRSKKIIFVGIVLLVLVAGILLAKKHNTAKVVDVYTVERSEISKTISSSGETEVIEDYTVLAPISGSVKKAYFKSGDNVKEGDLVLELDAQALSSASQSNYTAYIETKNNLATLDQKFDAAKADITYLLRVRDQAWREYMGDDGESKKQAYKLAEANYLDALSALQILKEQKLTLQQGSTSTYEAFLNAQTAVSKTKFLAPASGNLALTNLQKNSSIIAGQEVFSVTNAKTLIFKAHIDEADVRLIKEGMRAVVNLDAYPDKFLEGKLEKIDTKVSILTNGSSVINATITFQTTDIKPIVGLNGSADMELEKKADLLAIPPEALFEEAGNTYVYGVENNVAIKTKVTKAIDGDNFTGISDGLAEGATIITGPDISLLADGMKVRSAKK